MTFAIVVANADQVIQVSDRRLTWEGALGTDAATKAGHMLCDDASVLYCFTGLATIHSHCTSSWLMDALSESAKQNSLWRELIEIFAERASLYFATTPAILELQPSYRRLTVMLTGYKPNGFIVNALISNFQDFVHFINHPEAQASFTVHAEQSSVPAPLNPTIIQAIGTFGALTDADEAELRRMLEQRAPAEAIRQKAASLVQAISDRHKSGGTVGKRLNTARLDFTNPTSPVSGYIADVIENGISLIDQVDCRSYGTGLKIGSFQLTAGSPVVFPKVHRNAPCPCGSGKKYRFCHRA